MIQNSDASDARMQSEVIVRPVSGPARTGGYEIIKIGTQEPKSELDPVEAITGIGLTSEYPNSCADESKETEPKLCPPQAFNSQGLAAPGDSRSPRAASACTDVVENPGRSAP